MLRIRKRLSRNIELIRRPRSNLRADVFLAAKMAALQTAMFPILVICLPKREVEGEEKAETGRHLKRKARIRACSKGAKRRAEQKREKERKRERKGKKKFNWRGISRAIFRGVSFLLRGPQTFSFSRRRWWRRQRWRRYPTPFHLLSAPSRIFSGSKAIYIGSGQRGSEAVRRNKSRLLYKCCQRE